MQAMAFNGVSMSVMNMYIILAYCPFWYCIIFILIMYIIDKINVLYLLTYLLTYLQLANFETNC